MRLYLTYDGLKEPTTIRQIMLATGKSVLELYQLIKSKPTFYIGEYFIETKKTGAKYLYTLTKNNIVKKDTRKDIAKILNVSPTALSSYVGKTLKGWTVGKEQVIDVKCLWDGETMHRDLTFAQCREITKTTGLKAGGNDSAREGRCKHFVFSEDRYLTEKNIGEVVKMYAKTKDRFYFGSMNALMRNVEANMSRQNARYLMNKYKCVQGKKGSIIRGEL